MPSIRDVLTSWYCEMAARFGPDATGSDAAMAAIQELYYRLLELLDDVGESPAAKGGITFEPDKVVEDSPAKGQVPFAVAGGFRLVNPSAIKLWVALKVLGDSALVTRDQLAVRTRLSHKTQSRLFKELAALGWLSYRTARGKGIWYKLHLPPAVLTESGAAYFQEQIQSQRERWEARWSERTREIEESKHGSVTVAESSKLGVTMPESGCDHQKNRP